MEEQTQSLHSEDSMIQSHAANVAATMQGQDYVKTKFRRELYILSIVFSLILLGAFLGIFIYYLQYRMLGGKDIIVPNHYLIKSVVFTPQSVTLRAEYQGEDNPIYPNIYSNILVNISLQTVPQSPSLSSSSSQHAKSQDIVSMLQIDIKDDESFHRMNENYDIHSARFQKENQLELKDVDFGPFDLEYANQGSKLAFIISRNSTGEKIFDTLDYDILVSQYFSTIGTFIPTGQFYGLGERRTSAFQFQRQGQIKNCTYGICNKYRFWNRNPAYVQSTFDNGNGNGQLSGYQPMYLVEEESENYSLIYIDNAYSGLEIDYYQKTSNSNNQESLIFSNFDSQLSFKIFLGDTDPETVVKQYHDLIGHFYLIPFWAMGYHHSKTFSFPIAQNLQSFIDNLSKLNIPIDSIWTNTEMNEFGNYFKLVNGDVAVMIQKMRDEHFLKWIPVIPTEVPNLPNNKEYIQIIEDANAFILSNKTKQPYLAQGVQAKSFFLDYNHLNSSQVFASALSDLFKQVHFDGILLYQNEPATLKTGEYVGSNQIDSSNGIFDSIYSQMTTFNFNDHLLNIDALHYNQPDAPYYYQQSQYAYEKDIHSLNGYMQASSTFEILQQQMEQTQPFIISSSNRPGSGMYAAHTTGTVLNDWSLLQSSFTEIFNFQLFGIPFTGSNICPIQLINDNNVASISELCARWYQVASVYPFMHSTQATMENDPFQFADYPYVFNSVKQSLLLRYSLLKHYYSLYVQKKGRGIVFKPVSFVFPQTQYLDYFLLNTNNTAIIGDSLFVYTVMTSGDQSTNSTQVQIGIPPNLWVNLLDTHIQYKGPFEAKYHFPFSASPLIFLREGHLVLWQQINQEKMIRASLLDSQFLIKGVLTVVKSADDLRIGYQAKGQTIGVLDYGNYEALQKCSKQGCELNMTVDVISEKNNLLDISITFLAEDTQYFEPGIVIQGIQLSGVIKYNEILLQYCQSSNTSTLPFDYITVKHILNPVDYFVVTHRTLTFKLSIPF